MQPIKHEFIAGERPSLDLARQEGIPMRPLLIAALLLPLPGAAQARFIPQAPPPNVERTPGIADRGTLPGEPMPVGHDLDSARKLISAGRRNGDLTRAEAKVLRREARQIGVLTNRYGSDGLSGPERREIDMRVHLLRAQVIAQRSMDKP